MSCRFRSILLFLRWSEGNKDQRYNEDYFAWVHRLIRVSYSSHLVQDWPIREEYAFSLQLFWERIVQHLRRSNATLSISRFHQLKQLDFVTNSHPGGCDCDGSSRASLHLRQSILLCEGGRQNRSNKQEEGEG